MKELITKVLWGFGCNCTTEAIDQIMDIIQQNIVKDLEWTNHSEDFITSTNDLFSIEVDEGVCNLTYIDDVIEENLSIEEAKSNASDFFKDIIKEHLNL